MTKIKGISSFLGRLPGRGRREVTGTVPASVEGQGDALYEACGRTGSRARAERHAGPSDGRRAHRPQNSCSV